MSFVRAEDSSLGSCKRAIERSLELIQFNFDRRAKKIAIKPNLCYYYDYSTGETTDPRFVGALIDVLRERFSKESEISVVESDASAMKCRYAFRMLGYEDMAKEKGVTLVNLSNDKSDNVEIRARGINLKLRIPQILREADLLVNVPKIKYQSGVKITCALKNIYGCNAYPKKYVYHKMLAETIVAMNEQVRSDLVVVDGMVVSGTRTKRLGLVMASEDPVAVDAAACRILGVNTKSVKHLALAQEKRIGNMHFVPQGESLSRIIELFPRKTLKDKMRELLARAYMKYFR